MVSFGALGMLLMSINGITNSAMVVSGRLLQNFEWPYFRLMCITSLLISLCFTARIAWVGVPLPPRSQLKWLSLRGLFGALTFTLIIASVRLGTSPGDAAALASINIIVAALFGRIFLKEKLKWPQAIAVLCSIAGATLISKPGFLFGKTSQDEAPLLGYILAAASGGTQASVFICARKSTKSSVLFLNLSPAVFCALVFGIITLTPLVDDASLTQPLNHPLLALSLISAFSVIQLIAMTTNTAASRWCPAAVSATINTSSKMVSGYAAQIFLFQKTPDLYTIGGAALMLLGVVIMALARLPGRQSQESVATGEGTETMEKGGSERYEVQDADDEDSESLASFIAAEFVECSPHDSQVRFRRPVTHEPSAQQFGMVVPGSLPKGAVAA